MRPRSFKFFQRFQLLYQSRLVVMVRFRASLVRYIRDLSLVSAATPAVIWQTQRYYVFRWISEVTQSFFIWRQIPQRRCQLSAWNIARWRAMPPSCLPPFGGNNFRGLYMRGKETASTIFGLSDTLPFDRDYLKNIKSQRYNQLDECIL